MVFLTIPYVLFLVVSRPWVYYRLADERVFRLWQAMRGVGEARLAEIDRLVQTYLQDRTLLQPISAAELLARLTEGDVILLDVRPAEEYAAGHLPGARSIPVAELEARLWELPRTKEIVAYCRGPYCVFADEAVALLHTNGYQARRLEAGLPDWHALGFPTERGTGGQPFRGHKRESVLAYVRTGGSSHCW